MSSVKSLTVTFLQVLDQAVKAGRTDEQTRDWYANQFKHLLRATDSGGCLVAGRDPNTLIPEDLSGAPYTFHFCRATRRLFRWAQEAGHVTHNRFTAFQGPPCGERQRTLTDDEYQRVMDCAGSALRRVLWFMKQTLARPGELRKLRWCEVFLDKNTIRLTKFKAKDRRRDGVKVRVIPLSPAAARLLGWWKAARQPSPEQHVFRNYRGKAWTSNALRCAMSRATKAAGVNLQKGERIVCYSLRHTGATEATRRGVRDRLLADILGHTTTRTTARYQHLAEEDLVHAISTATKRPRPLPKPEPRLKLA